MKDILARFLLPCSFLAAGESCSLAPNCTEQNSRVNDTAIVPELLNIQTLINSVGKNVDNSEIFQNFISFIKKK